MNYFDSISDGIYRIEIISIKDNNFLMKLYLNGQKIVRKMEESYLVRVKGHDFYEEITSVTLNKDNFDDLTDLVSRLFLPQSQKNIFIQNVLNQFN